MDNRDNSTDKDALTALLIAYPEQMRNQIRATGLSESSILHMIARTLDEFEFCQWWNNRYKNGIASDHNPDMRAWLSRRELCESSLEGYSRRSRYPKHSALAELLFTIPGICQLYVTPYELTVYKSMAFSWDEIAPRVAEIIDGINAEQTCTEEHEQEIDSHGKDK